MKKIIVLLLITLISTSAVLADSDIKEEKLNLNFSDSINAINKQKQEELKRRDINNELRMEGEDYMYRLQQQMMQRQNWQNWNPYGGYRY